MRNVDVAIIGGGVIGCALARALAGEGVRVAVIERGAPGEEASWAAAGMLAPSAEAEQQSPVFALGLASLERYNQLAPELLSETGIDCEYRAVGSLVLFSDEAERQAWTDSLAWQRNQGVPIQELSATEVREREPQLAPFAGAFFLPGDHQVDNRRLMKSLVQSCRIRGVEFVLGKAALEVERNGSRATGVRLENDRISAGQVVNAAGSWAGAIRVPGLAPAPIRPVKGHMLALQTDSLRLRHVARCQHIYVVPRSGGRFLIGSTMEEAGFDKTARAGQLTGLLNAAQRICPELQQSAFAEFWTGLRPASSDGVPMLGPTSLDGYFAALGHFRNGILLAPITAEILTGWLLRGRPPVIANQPALADAFLPARFTPGRLTQ
jgi:glycine oxidase